MGTCVALKKIQSEIRIYIDSCLVVNDKWFPIDIDQDIRDRQFQGRNMQAQSAQILFLLWNSTRQFITEETFIQILSSTLYLQQSHYCTVGPGVRSCSSTIYSLSPNMFLATAGTKFETWQLCTPGESLGYGSGHQRKEIATQWQN